MSADSQSYDKISAVSASASVSEAARAAPCIVLDTGLFADRETLSAALAVLDVPASHQRTLHPTTMNDGDWDEILNLVLSANRVITL